MAIVKPLVWYDDTKRYEFMRIGDVEAVRYAAYTTAVSVNANLVVQPGVSYSLPAATLTVNRTIDLTALNSEADYIEIDNQEAGFVWSFTGGLVYDAYENTITNLTANTRYILKRTNNKIKIFN